MIKLNFSDVRFQTLCRHQENLWSIQKRKNCLERITHLYKDKNPLYTSRTPSIPIEMNKLQLSCCFVILKV